MVDGILGNMELTIKSVAAMLEFGAEVGTEVTGGTVIELVGDVGAGKTTFVKGLARGLEIDDDVLSPSFTISRVYEAHQGLCLMHYDFYRLGEPGIMSMELAEAVQDPRSIVVVEWADVTRDVLPTDRLTIRFASPTQETRTLAISAGGDVSRKLLKAIE